MHCFKTHALEIQTFTVRYILIYSDRKYYQLCLLLRKHILIFDKFLPV